MSDRNWNDRWVDFAVAILVINLAIVFVVALIEWRIALAIGIGLMGGWGQAVSASRAIQDHL